MMASTCGVETCITFAGFLYSARSFVLLVDVSEELK